MKLLWIVWIKCKRILTSKIFWYCSLFVMGLCMTAGLYRDSDAKIYSILEVMVYFSQREMVQYSEMAAENVFFCGCNSTSGNLFFIVLAALPYIAVACGDRESKAFRYQIIRMKRMHFYVSDFITAFLSGGLTLLMGYLLFGILVWIRFPKVQDYISAGSWEWEGVLPTDPMASRIFLQFAGIALCGALLGMFAFLLSAKLRNIYTVCTIPFVFHYAYGILQNKLFLAGKRKLCRFLAAVSPDTWLYFFRAPSDILPTVTAAVLFLLFVLLSYIFLRKWSVDYGD